VVSPSVNEDVNFTVGHAQSDHALLAVIPACVFFFQNIVFKNQGCVEKVNAMLIVDFRALGFVPLEFHLFDLNL